MSDPGSAPQQRLQSTAAALLHRLAQHGIKQVFGIPGAHNLPLYRHLDDSGLRHTTARHEQGAGYAADGYARATGVPAVCLTTSGPGITNALTAVATAYADSVPMFVVSPGLPRKVDGRGTGFLHEMKDQHGAVAAVAARSERLHSAADAVAAVDRAMAEYAVGRRRPIHWEIPLESLQREGTTPETKPFGSLAAAPEPDGIDRAIGVLQGSERVALVLGGGTVDAGREATDLAHRLGAPVITTVNGKGTVSERDPLALGASIRLPAAKEFLRRCDAVLAVGTELAESDLWEEPPLALDGQLIRVDVDPDQLHKNAVADLALRGDAGLVLAALGEGLPDVQRRVPEGLLADLRQEIDRAAARDGAVFQPLIAALEDGLGEDPILACDSTMAAYYGAVHFLRLRRSRSFLYPTGFATLGYSVSAALGAKLARPDSAVAALIGDGGLLFALGELSTVAAASVPLPIIVYANDGYGEIRREMVADGIDPIGVDIPAYGVGELADAFSLVGEQVSDMAKLPALLRAALGRDRATLLEVRHS